MEEIILCGECNIDEENKSLEIIKKKYVRKKCEHNKIIL